jgi:hypothetical protein
MGWMGLSDKIPSCYLNRFGFYVADITENTSYPVQKKWLGESDFYVLYAEGKKADMWRHHYYVDWIEKGIVFNQHDISDSKTRGRTIVLVEPDFGDNKILFTQQADMNLNSLVFSPRGRKIAYHKSSKEKDFYDYFIADSDNLNKKHIATAGWADYIFNGFSPDGRYIVIKYQPTINIEDNILKIYDTQKDMFYYLNDNKIGSYYEFRNWIDSNSFIFYEIKNFKEDGQSSKNLWLYLLEEKEKYLLVEQVD